MTLLSYRKSRGGCNKLEFKNFGIWKKNVTHWGWTLFCHHSMAQNLTFISFPSFKSLYLDRNRCYISVCWWFFFPWFCFFVIGFLTFLSLKIVLRGLSCLTSVLSRSIITSHLAAFFLLPLFLNYVCFLSGFAFIQSFAVTSLFLKWSFSMSPATQATSVTAGKLFCFWDL